MDKAEAVMTIVRDARQERATNASARRVVKALKCLGIEGPDLIRVLCYLDYCKKDGTSYGLTRIW